jgi:hypothetical protein
MNGASRRRTIAAGAWLAIAVVVWNVIYDLLMTRAVKEHLARAAMHEAGRGPFVPLSQVMSVAVYDAVWKSTLAAGLILLAGLLTIRYVGKPSA